MADFGHELRFGSFITPQNRRPQDVLALAQLSERVGLDLVTFQDHPYQPAFLDTWTLLAWVAARTERVHVSGNVLNLPLRPPAVLARAAASLDLLSGGLEPDCMILDLMLPDGEGEAVLREVRERHLRTHVAVCTGTALP